MLHPSANAIAGCGLVLLAVALGCQHAGGEAAGLVPPLALAEGQSAYEAAAQITLAETAPQDHAELHNVFRLSDNIVSGSEPEGEAGMERIAEMGVKTILSVDGKAPDQRLAEKHGMRYVHVPIQYSGITEDERLRIAKSFRELEGPFYVHCFHGQHRGPAAAAVGRLVLDEVPREQALAEMRQWCGTSASYEGLYRTIAMAELPSADETSDLDWDFPAEHSFAGFRQCMVEVARAYDHLAALAERDWGVDASHPDLHPPSEARKLATLFSQGAELEEVLGQPRDFQDWLTGSADEARTLTLELEKSAAERDADAARASLGRIRALCKSCHASYRN